jgi:hypothetical protein
MNRRDFALTAFSSTALLLGCDTEQKPSHTATLLNNSGVQEALKSVEDAISSLESNVDGFDNENWRDVVPEVKSAADDVRSAFELLRHQLGASEPS